MYTSLDQQYQQETFKSMLVIALVVCVVCLAPSQSEAEVTEWVQRRQGGDIYKTNQYRI